MRIPMIAGQLALAALLVTGTSASSRAESAMEGSATMQTGAMPHAAGSADPAAQSRMPVPVMPHDTMAHDAMPAPAMSQDAMPTEAMPHETMPRPHSQLLPVWADPEFIKG